MYGEKHPFPYFAFPVGHQRRRLTMLDIIFTLLHIHTYIHYITRRISRPCIKPAAGIVCFLGADRSQGSFHRGSMIKSRARRFRPRDAVQSKAPRSEEMPCLRYTTSRQGLFALCGTLGYHISWSCAQEDQARASLIFFSRSPLASLKPNGGV